MDATLQNIFDCRLVHEDGLEPPQDSYVPSDLQSDAIAALPLMRKGNFWWPYQELNPDDPLIRRTCCFTSYGHGTWGFPRDLNSAIRFTRPTHRHLCLESNWSRWGESNSRIRVLQTRAFPLGYTRELWCSHRELNSDPMFKRHLRFHYAIGAWYWRRDSNSHHALIRGSRLIKPLHYQLCYASRNVALSAGVEPASFRLRFTRLEGETDTRADHFPYAIFHFSFFI